MNKLLFLVSFLLISILLSGCRSKVSDTSIAPVIKFPFSSLKKISKIISPGDTTVFEYNSDGKLSRILYGGYNFTDGNIFKPYLDITSYTYSGDTVFVVYRNGNILPDRYYMVLDSQGLISTLSRSNELKEIFLNDNNGNCIKQIFNWGEIKFKYSGSNMISAESQGLKYEFTYYADKVNTVRPNRYGAVYGGVIGSWFYHFGNENINLIKTDTEFKGGTKSTISYTYEFDANNYVTKRTIKFEGGSSYDQYYTYR